MALGAWIDPRLRALGCGIEWGFEPTHVLPLELPGGHAEFMEEMVVAVDAL